MGNPKKIQSIERAFRILEAISFEPLSLTEVSKAVKLHIATTFQLVSTIESLGYVFKDAATKKYNIGLKMSVLTEALWRKNSCKSKAKPYLQLLAKVCNETAHLAIYENSLISIIDVELSSGILIVNSEIGEKVLPHSSAVGKAILACLPENITDSILSEKLTRLTPKTITSKQDLKIELKKIRRLGYAIDDEETSLSVRCVASPVFNKNGVVAGAIGISGPSIRIKKSNIGKFANEVKKNAEELSGELGFKKKNP